jgi:broad specificity phosphatase PhoE
VPTTTIILVRHAAYDGVGQILAGRRPGIALNARGVEQANRLASELAQDEIAQVLSSPRLRARQTARPIAAACALPLQIAADFDELDYGEWTGRSTVQLSRDAQWRHWNEHRATSRPPRGESMGELQIRVLRGLASVAAANLGRRVVVVSHAEPIRAAVLHFRGLSLDQFACVQIEPASATALSIETEPDGVARHKVAAMVPA